MLFPFPGPLSFTFLRCTVSELLKQIKLKKLEIPNEFYTNSLGKFYNATFNLGNIFCWKLCKTGLSYVFVCLKIDVITSQWSYSFSTSISSAFFCFSSVGTFVMNDHNLNHAFFSLVETQNWTDMHTFSLL